MTVFLVFCGSSKLFFLFLHPVYERMNDFTIPGVKMGESLGVGCTGEVFAATGPDEEEFVVKRFRSISIDRKFLEGNFQRMLAMPPHEGIARLTKFQVNEAPYFSVTEKAPGQSFGELDSIKESQTWPLIQRITEGLGHAHKFGVIHGNLHSGNLFCQKPDADTSEKSGKNEAGESRITITDFGAGMVGNVHHIDLDEHTFFFSPDQLECDGREWRDGRAMRWDVYNFGVIAYCLINGRLPRGQEYLRQWRKEVAQGGGRPVPVDTAAYIESIRNSPEIRWSRKLGVTREQKLFRAIIEDCLALDPSRRPVDLREVRNRFRALKSQFALEDAEDRVVKERLKQKAKLFGARALAISLGLFFLLATFYLVDFLRKSYFLKNKVSELGQVVTAQRVHIDTLDRNWSNTKTDLKQSRRAADAFFSTMAHGDNAGGSGVASLKKNDLEKSRKYYRATLKDVSSQEDGCVERARAQHSLAHIEQKLGNRKEALRYFKDAIASLNEALAAVQEKEIDSDLHLRMADCYENISQLMDHPMSSEALTVLLHAVEHFDYVLKDQPDEVGVVLRQAGTTLRLGTVYDAHRKFDKAIAAYSKSAELAEGLREHSPKSKALSELLGKLQFRVAKSLRKAGRIDESINAHIAAMETTESLRGIEGYLPMQAIQMAESFIELGELFGSKKDASPDDLDQLYNESLRLLTPLNTKNPGDVDVAILLCRSLTHLGLIENETGHWTAGYRLCVRGIEALKNALGEKPTHIEGILTLAEARIELLKFLDSEETAAANIALRGIESAEQAKQALEANTQLVEPIRSQLHQRLGKVFHTYGDICKSLGEIENSNRCHTEASKSLSYVNSASQAKL